MTRSMIIIICTLVFLALSDTQAFNPNRIIDNVVKTLHAFENDSSLSDMFIIKTYPLGLILNAHHYVGLEYFFPGRRHQITSTLFHVDVYNSWNPLVYYEGSEISRGIKVGYFININKKNKTYHCGSIGFLGPIPATRSESGCWTGIHSIGIEFKAEDFYSKITNQSGWNGERQALGYMVKYKRTFIRWRIVSQLEMGIGLDFIYQDGGDPKKRGNGEFGLVLGYRIF